MNPQLELFHKQAEKATRVMASLLDEHEAGKWDLASEPGPLGDELSHSFQEMGILYMDGSTVDKALIADYYAVTLHATEMLYKFADILFKGIVGSGLIEDAADWLNFIQSCQVSWTSQSQKMRTKLLKDGLLQDHLNHLHKLRQTINIQRVRYMIAVNLGIICTCAQEAEFEIYCHRFPWVAILNPWLSCPFTYLKLPSKFLLGRVSSVLESHELSLLEVNEKEMKALVDCLEEAADSPDLASGSEDLGFVFNADELLTNLRLLAVYQPNRSKMLAMEIIQLASKFVSIKNLSSQVAACRLLWELVVETKDVKDYVSGLRDELQPLLDSEHSELQVVSECLLVAMQKSSSADDSALYAQGCYMFERYADSVQSCNHLERHELWRQVKVLKAKALYHLYRQELKVLRMRNMMPVSEFHMRHSTCCMNIRDTIILLGEALDEGLITPQDEENKILDESILQYIWETNKLYECQRCYLCRQKVQGLKEVKKSKLTEESSEESTNVAKHGEQVHKEKHSTEILNPENETTTYEDVIQREEESIDTTEQMYKDTNDEGAAASVSETGSTVDPKTIPYGKAKTASKLLRSHQFPRAILSRFSAAHPLPTSKQTYQELYLFPSRMDKLRSAGSLTCYMLCSNCEQLLSAHGESQFIPMFFDRVYDINNPLQEKQVIEYGIWLYQFCIGMIFRTLYYEKDKFLNSEEIHEVLKQCRECLLNVDCMHKVAAISKPTVYILITPLFATEDEFVYGPMNLVLNNSVASVTKEFSLQDGRYDALKAHFFLIHMGMVNILVPFSPSQDAPIPDEYCINPEGGVYIVPPSDARKDLVPLGVWRTLQTIAQEMEQRLRECPVKVNAPLKLETIKPKAQNAETYGIMSGRDKEKAAEYYKDWYDKPSEIPGTQKRLDLLPPGFHFRPKHFPNSVYLPTGHSMLLHHTNLSKDGVHVSLFLCIGKGNGYSLDKPYLIWHHDHPGVRVTAGFFISPSDLTATDFLPDKNPKTAISGKKPQCLNPFVSKLPQTFPQILKKKGFFSLTSLLNRVQHIENLAAVDSTCDSKVNCWYCRHLCSNCLTNSVPFGLSVKCSDGKEFQFCSKDCQKLSPESPLSPFMHVLDSEGGIFESESALWCVPLNSRCAPIGKCHTRLLHVFAWDNDASNYPTETEIAVCMCKNSPPNRTYIVWSHRTLVQQQFLEFFISKDFTPEEPLPYLRDTAAVAAIKDLEMNGLVQKYLMKADATIKTQAKKLLQTPSTSNAPIDTAGHDQGPAYPSI